nr:hypothetical protein [Lachnospiraceae bacterium]
MNYKSDKQELPGFDDFIRETAPKKHGYVRQQMSDFFKILEIAQEAAPEDMKIPVDTYGCDCMFVKGFITEELMDDFPLVLKDFMEHESANIDKYEMVDYFKVDDGTCWPERVIFGYGLNLMYNAYLGGSEYARKLFLYLYKVYFRKEYRQLKKFSRIGAQDIVTLSDEGDEDDFYRVARYLTMSKISGIEVSSNCVILYRQLNSMNEEDEAEDFFEKATKPDEYKELIKKAHEDILTMFGSHDKLLKYDAKVRRFMSKVLAHYGYCPEFVDYCDQGIGLTSSVIETLVILKQISPNKEFTKSEVMVYTSLLHALGALTSSNDETIDRLRNILYGKRGTDFYDYFPEKFKPEEVDGSVLRSKAPEKVQGKPAEKKEADQYKDSDLVEEIASLRRKLHQKESEIKQYRLELAETRKLSEEVKELKIQAEIDGKELAALRSHVYNLTESDDEDDTVPIQDVIDSLNKLQIIIIGGHPNWVTKMKGYFPEWEFISPSPTGTIPASVVDKADKVFFFTDTISHAAYYKYINAVRERNVKFGYIHGTNVDKCIRGIWQEITDI